MSHRDKDSDYRAAFLSPLDYGEKFSDLVGAKGADPDAESDPSLSDESWAASPATRAEVPTRLPEMTEKCKGCLGEGVYMGDGGAGGTCGICNGSGQMPLAAPPAITQGHLEIFRQAEVTSFTKRDAVFAHERMAEIRRNLEALSTGSHGLYEKRESVVVKREKVIGAMQTLRTVANHGDTWTTSRLEELRDDLAGWLTVDKTQRTEPEREEDMSISHVEL